MFVRLVYQSFLRQRRRKLLAATAVALGTAVTTAMLVVASDIGDKISRELRGYGANIAVYPQEDTLDVRIGGVNLKPSTAGAYLDERELWKIKQIFWRHNIVGYAPFLQVPVEVSTGTQQRNVELIGTYFDKRIQLSNDDFTTGVTKTHPWWRVTGAWPADDGRDDVLIGRRLAATLGTRTGEFITLSGRRLRVTGMLDTGAAEDDAVVAPLALVQEIAGRPNAVRRVLVSALTKPEDAFARRDPGAMNPADRDRWYCSPYANSIAFQLREALPGAQAEQIRQVAQNEGAVLGRIRGLMLLVTLAALFASALAVAAAMATAILERKKEVGLMKALGAPNGMIAAVFYTEAGVLALAGGALGFAGGALLAQQISRAIFGTSVAVQPVLFPLVVALAILVTCGASAAAIRRGVAFEPAMVLRGDA
ncbi:MAG: ABC transporter permease [Candidatus Koribacter versatilis]|uniref:ABC transporter permease n=1 Tax=Candidatus Korobacter versatilis TaxID=658062 RepID=A0A932A6C5_9BACT|nr:ABC transporter permease [Candidatus Koribacter versatilis]